MLAPPRPPSAPEALIPEARDRQRRRRLLIAATIGALAATALAVYAGAGGRTTGRAGAARSGSAPLCSMASLAVHAVGMSSPTGLGRTALVFTNSSGTTCRAAGYPTVSLGDSAGTIPFAYARMGSAGPVTIASHGTAYAVVSKYRCDYGDRRGATTATVTLGAESRHVPLQGPALCRPGIAAEGRVVMVYPFKHSLRSAYEGSLAEFPT